jgi:murein DD-endopeptidase MepM/ murein hydrolase activator NlpD
MTAATEWTWPVADPEVVTTFDPPDAPWNAGHRGVDLTGSEGDTVRAAGAGTVTYAGLLAGVGVVTVSHGELRTTYQPVEASVSVGQRVHVGQEIGTLTAIGSHCAPSTCLHWGLLQGDTYLDPLSVIGGAGRPRLLPLGDEALAPVPADDGHSAVGPTHSGSPADESLTSQASQGALAGIVSP